MNTTLTPHETQKSLEPSRADKVRAWLIALAVLALLLISEVQPLYNVFKSCLGEDKTRCAQLW